MRKLFSLFINEMQKNGKKVTVFVLVIIMTIGMFGCSAFFKTVTYFNGNYVGDTIEENIEIEQQLKKEIEALEGFGETNSDYLYNLKREWHQFYLFGSYFEENNISKSSFKSIVLNSMDNSYKIMLQEEFCNFEEGTNSALYLEHKKNYDFYHSIILSGNFKDYIEYENNIINELNTDEKSKEFNIKYNKMLYEICPSGEFGSEDERVSIINLVSQIIELEYSIEKNINPDDNVTLTEAKKEELKLELEIAKLKLEEKVYINEDDDAYTAFSMSSGVGSLFVLIILIILAGAMMSSETSTGTIKSLIIAPVKRWKIYVAKYLSLIAIMILLSVYVYVLSIVINGLLFGFSSYGAQICVVMGKATIMSYFESQFFYMVCSMVSLLVFVTLAYMMSVVTKNTAASVSVAMGVYLGGSVIHTLLMGFLYNREYITKFLPFNNIDWYSLIFSSSGTETVNVSTMFVGGFFSNPSSLLFAVFYTVILLICMNWIGLESFCKKDIK